MKIELISDIKGHSAPIYKLQVAADVLYSASSDKMLATWDLENNSAAPFSIKAESALYTFLITERYIFLGASSGTMNVIDRKKKEEVRNLKIHKKGTYVIYHVQEKDLLVTGGGDGFVHFFSYSSLELIRSIKLSSAKIRSIHYCDESDRLLIGCGEGNIRFIELNYYNEDKVINASSESINIIRSHPRKSALVSSGRDGMMRVWKKSDWSLLFEFPAHHMAVYDLAFNDDASQVITASRDKSIKLWDANTFSILEKLERKTHHGHTHSVNSIAWTSNTEFVSAGDDRVIKKWRIL